MDQLTQLNQQYFNGELSPETLAVLQAVDFSLPNVEVFLRSVFRYMQLSGFSPKDFYPTLATFIIKYQLPGLPKSNQLYTSASTERRLDLILPNLLMNIPLRDIQNGTYLEIGCSCPPFCLQAVQKSLANWTFTGIDPELPQYVIYDKQGNMGFFDQQKNLFHIQQSLTSKNYGNAVVIKKLFAKFQHINTLIVKKIDSLLYQQYDYQFGKLWPTKHPKNITNINDKLYIFWKQKRLALKSYFKKNKHHYRIVLDAASFFATPGLTLKKCTLEQYYAEQSAANAAEHSKTNNAEHSETNGAERSQTNAPFNLITSFNVFMYYDNATIIKMIEQVANLVGPEGYFVHGSSAMNGWSPFYMVYHKSQNTFKAHSFTFSFEQLKPAFISHWSSLFVDQYDRLLLSKHVSLITRDKLFSNWFNRHFEHLMVEREFMYRDAAGYLHASEDFDSAEKIQRYRNLINELAPIYAQDIIQILNSHQIEATIDSERALITVAIKSLPREWREQIPYAKGK